MDRPPKPGDSFEETYPRYLFSDLVTLSLRIARFLVRSLARLRDLRSRHQTVATPGQEQRS